MLVVLAVGLLTLTALAVIAATTTWLRRGFDGPAALTRHDRRDRARLDGLAAARDRGHELVGPTIDVWVYACDAAGCLGTVGVVDGRDGPGFAGTAVDHDCPTTRPTDWDAATHIRHGGPLHDH